MARLPLAGFRSGHDRQAGGQPRFRSAAHAECTPPRESEQCRSLAPAAAVGASRDDLSLRKMRCDRRQRFDGHVQRTGDVSTRILLGRADVNDEVPESPHLMRRRDVDRLRGHRTSVFRPAREKPIRPLWALAVTLKRLGARRHLQRRWSLVPEHTSLFRVAWSSDGSSSGCHAMSVGTRS